MRFIYIPIESKTIPLMDSGSELRKQGALKTWSGEDVTAELWHDIIIKQLIPHKAAVFHLADKTFFEYLL